MIYNKDGTALTSAYDVSADGLSYAYDVDGNNVFTAQPTTIKVMTYNVGQWYIGGGDNVPSDKDAAYYALQNGMIQSANADILCIEEYWDQFSKTGRTALSMLQQYYPYIQTRSGASGYFGRAICSKYPLTDYTQHAYSNESSRYYDSATVTIIGIPITVVVTHLNVNDISKRSAQIAELITFLQQQTRFISCGDYNMLDCKSSSGEDYTAVMQPILNAGFHSANCSTLGFLETYSNAPNGTYTGCLDNIVTSSNITIDSAYVDETKRTDNIADLVDHMPLIATLTL